MKSIIFFLIGICFAEQVYLINDSPFPLTAVVKGFNGAFLGKQLLQAGEQKKLQLTVPQQVTTSVSPYMVIWECQYGGFYSITPAVLPGAQAIASQGNGAHFCAPKKESEEKNP